MENQNKQHTLPEIQITAEFRETPKRNSIPHQEISTIFIANEGFLGQVFKAEIIRDQTKSCQFTARKDTAISFVNQALVNAKKAELSIIPVLSGQPQF